MTTRNPVIKPVEVEAFFMTDRPGYPDGKARLLIVSVGPRYRRMVQPEVILSIRHRTTGGTVSVLLDGARQAELLAWLDAPGADLRWKDAQTAGRLTWAECGGEPAAELKLWWVSTTTGKPTGSGRSAIMDVDSLASLHDQLLDSEGLQAMTGKRPPVPS
jgi:hypothetical protein